MKPSLNYSLYSNLNFLENIVISDDCRIAEAEESTSGDNATMAVDDEFKLENYDDDEGRSQYNYYYKS